jgi:hypothetical protein
MGTARQARYSRMQLFGIVAVTALVTSAVVGGGLVLAGAGPTPNKYYACAKNNVVSGAIKVNTKPTCPAGQKVVVWNQAGAKGAAGSTGVNGLPGANGATGATGVQGPGGLPQLGTFTAKQIVNGAILDCTNVSTTDCNFPKLNGLDLVASNPFPTVNAICAVVRGTSWNSIGNGASSTATRFTWNGSKWVTTTTNDQFINYIQCV